MQERDGQVGSVCTEGAGGGVLGQECGTRPGLHAQQQYNGVQQRLPPLRAVVLRRVPRQMLLYVR